MVPRMSIASRKSLAAVPLFNQCMVWHAHVNHMGTPAGEVDVAQDVPHGYERRAEPSYGRDYSIACLPGFEGRQ